jgi:hypothetical protein
MWLRQIVDVEEVQAKLLLRFGEEEREDILKNSLPHNLLEQQKLLRLELGEMEMGQILEEDLVLL